MAKKIGVPVRKDDLLVQKLGEETIVYDLSAHRAHSLNRTAGLVFEKLDGKRDVDAITRELSKSLGRDSRPELVAVAIHELADANLLQTGSALPRRSILRGIAAGLLPVVASIAVPPAATAASCVPEFATCVYGVDVCCGGGCYQCVDFGSGFTCENRC